MEEKLDKLIELMEAQNKLLKRVMNQQTTNNSIVHRTTPASRVGPTDMDHLRRTVGAPPNVGTNGLNVQQMIEEARAKAMAQINEKVGDSPDEE